MDEQQLERLMQCQEIQKVTKHCHERRNKWIVASSSNKNNEKVVEVEEEWKLDETFLVRE
jgi:hypothetical protein